MGSSSSAWETGEAYSGEKEKKGSKKGNPAILIPGSDRRSSNRLHDNIQATILRSNQVDKLMYRIWKKGQSGKAGFPRWTETAASLAEVPVAESPILTQFLTANGERKRPERGESRKVVRLRL